MKTFIHHNGALGDILLSLPCLQKLRLDCGQLHIAGRYDVAGFLRQAGVADEALSSDSSLFASLYGSPDYGLRGYLSGFDRAFIFSVRPDVSVVSALRESIPLIRVICTVPPDHLKIHAAGYRLSQLGPGLELCESPSLAIPKDHLAEALSLIDKAGFKSGARIITMHPGSGGRSKCWPLERYFDLVDRLRAIGDFFTIIFSGPAEDAELKKKIDGFALGRDRIFHARDAGLITAAALLSLSAIYIGNDSGFTHLAAATGSATIALFGPTDPVVWKPTGRRVEAISTPSCSLEDISTEMVFESALSMISGKK